MLSKKLQKRKDALLAKLEAVENVTKTDKEFVIHCIREFNIDALALFFFKHFAITPTKGMRKIAPLWDALTPRIQSVLKQSMGF